jgi:hypothetical protein
MGRSKKLAVGAALGVIPFLVGQTPAAAAVAQDSDHRDAVYTAAGGDRVLCFIDASHEVDTGTGGLDVELSASCRGTLDITVRYVDENGEAITTSTTARGGNFQSISLHKVGSTAVTADYQIVIDGCASDCTHTLQTSTK